MSSRVNLVGIPQLILRNRLAGAGFTARDCRQVTKYIHKHGGKDLGSVPELSKAKRAELASNYQVNYGKIVSTQESEDDGVCKWLVELNHGETVETVFIPETSTAGVRRGVLCVSSQIMVAREHFEDFGKANGSHSVVSNVVFMGQGEPLYNWRNLVPTVDVITDHDALNIAARRVTVSSSGVAPLIPKVGSVLNVNLAVSLHAPEDSLRSRIMGINDTYPLSVLMQKCKEYTALRRKQHVLFEYTLLQGVNDGMEQARELVSLVQDINCHINLIPFNPWPGAPYTGSDDDTIRDFGKYLLESGIPTSIRWPKGRSIMAACGQLRYAEEERRMTQE